MIYLLILGIVLLGGYGAMSIAGDSVNNSFDPIFIRYGQMFNVDPKLLKRISWIESRIGLDSRVRKGIENPSDIEASKSYDGLSWGIMQVTVTTARDYDKSATAEKLNDPAYSVLIAAQHIRFLQTRYPQFKERDIVMAYNHGQGNQLRFLEKENDGSLSPLEFQAGRDYYNKYQQAKKLIP